MTLTPGADTPFPPGRVFAVSAHRLAQRVSHATVRCRGGTEGIWDGVEPATSR